MTHALLCRCRALESSAVGGERLRVRLSSGWKRDHNLGQADPIEGK